MRFLPFWIFLIFFKFGAGLHYTLVSPFGEKLLPLWIVGLLMGGSSILQLLLDVPAGHLLDKYGYRRLLKITTFVFLFAAGMYVFGLTKPIYLISLVIGTFGWLFFGPGVNAYILSHAPRENAGKFISKRDIFGSIGIVLSSASLPFVLLFTPQHIGFILFSLLAVAFIMLFFSPKDKTSVHEDTKVETQHYYIKRKHPISTLKAISKLNPASTMLLLLDFSGAIFYGAIWFVVPLVIAHQATGAHLLGWGLGAFDLAIVILGYLLGNLADTANKRTLVFFGLLLFAVSGILLGFNFGILFILFGFLATAGDEMAGISLWSWLHSLDKNHANDGLIAGVINLFQDLGWAIGPIFAGIMFGSLGPTWTIVLCTIPICTTWIIYQFYVRHQPRYAAAHVPKRPHKARHRT